MSDLEHARELMRAAGRDLSALRGMVDDRVFADEIFGFHAQQAVEKSFKAWLALLGEEYPLTHDLEVLLASLTACDGEASRFEGLIQFTPYAVVLRYADAAPSTELPDRDETLPRVEALVERVRRMAEEEQAEASA